MSARYASITCDLELSLVVSGHRLDVPVMLTYDADDPFAVTAAFDTGEADHVTWVFARDLLSEGLRRPAGQGDVGVWPSMSEDRDVVCIALSSPDGQALFEASRERIEEFVARTFALVPADTELAGVDIDAELGQLLEQA